MAEDQPDALFHGVAFTVIPGPNIDDDQERQLLAILGENGAVHIPLLRDGAVDKVANHTHIVTEDVDFPDYSAALDYGCHVVRPSWVHQSYEKRRQAQPRQHSPDPSMFFREVIVSCADLPEGDKDAIIAGTLALGGLYSAPLTKLVTHVVAMDMDNDKCRTVQDKRLRCKVVLPHWFDDCLKLGKLINERPYLLPDPEVLRAPSNDYVRAKQSPALDGATSAVAGPPPAHHTSVSPSESRKQLAAFKDRKVLFSKDLNVNDHLARTLRQLVSQAEGSLTSSVDECDVYVGHYRDGMDYVSASRADKTVGNLAWFYNVINRNRWTNPLSKLLHYPVPRGGIPGFAGMRISLSNYSGEARIYLENLTNEAGAEFTKTMKQDNTHLITAHTHSEKYDAAQEWNIEIVNHLWLEESYAKCTVMSLTNKRYTHFPPRTNLSEIVGQTPIDIDRVRKLYFAREERTIKDAEMDRDADGKTPHPFRGAVKPASSSKKVVPQSSAVSKSKSAEAPDPMEVDSSEFVAPQTARKRKARVGSDAAVRTPSALKQTEKENDTPSTTGRASKERARSMLQAQRDDIALFAREMKRKGGVIHGGRRTADAEADGGATKPAPKTRKRKSDEAGNGDGTPDISETEMAGAKPAGRKTKKAKASKEDVSEFPETVFTMMVSGDERWLGKPKKESDDATKLALLGIALTQDPAECTLLCAPRILRTRKFIAALANAPEVVNTSYLDEALRKNALPSLTQHTLSDDEAEERLGFRLDVALERAAVNKRRLLRGWAIFVTEKVSGGFDTYKEIISINGGQALLYRGRTGVQFLKRQATLEDAEAGAEVENQGDDEETDVVYLISGTLDEEVKLWEKFRTSAEKQGLRAKMAKTDWLINLAMSQRVEWDDKWELKEELVPGWSGKNGR